ncbi:hypothetical protein 1 [Kummerowia striata tombusvirus]|nr:hypothetical protein 1 [Kummerowia striata tombusvirus]
MSLAYLNIGQPLLGSGPIDHYRMLRFGSMSPTWVPYANMSRGVTDLDDFDFPDPPPVRASAPPAHVIPAATVESQSHWDNFWRKVSRVAMAFCGMQDVVADWERDIKFRSHVSAEMRQTLQLSEDESESVAVVKSVNEVNKVDVQHVPRLVAHATVALRMKLGLGAMDRSVPGNVSLVRAETAKLLRDWGVRTMDAAAHLLEIERCFFEDDTHYRVTTWRARACARSRLVRWCLSKWTGGETPRFDY